MKQTLMALFVAVMAALTMNGQDWAKANLEKSPRHGEWVNIPVTVKEGTRKVNCFITYPEVKDKATAVVVIHEIFGLSEWARSVTDQLAAAGYIAIAPDFLTGSATNGGGTADILQSGGDVRAAIGKLSPNQITADLNAAVDYVSKLPSCNGKVAVGGFCWGGTQTFRFVTNNKDVKAGFVFYGSGPDSEEALAKINCPVYGFYGENDNRINATIPKSKELMTKVGKTYKPVTYTGAGHGFMRAGEQPNPEEANKKAREDAWTRWKELLKKL